MLHPEAHKGDTKPAAEAGEDRFSAGSDQFDDICVKPDGSHCHNDEELAQFLQWRCHFRRKLKYRDDDGRKYKK